MNFFRRWRLKEHVYQQSLQQRSGRWPFSDLAFVLKNLHSPCMFCWFCLSKSQDIFSISSFVSVLNICEKCVWLWYFTFEFCWIFYHEWLLLLAGQSNEKQIQVCLEPLPGQRNQIVWDLFSWFWSKSGFWLSIILRRS